MFTHQFRIATIISMSLSTVIGFAQEEENLGTEVVNVVKPYTPSVQEAFKVKATPQLNDSITEAKKKVTYSIYSVPVASTFTPTKGRAADVKKAKKMKLYDNYTTLGFGSYTSALAELYSNFQIDRNQYFGIFLNHNSSQDAVDESVTDDYFYDTRLNLNYGSRERDFSWRTDLDLQHQVYNYYGVAPEFVEMLPLDSPLFASDYDASQTYFTAGINGMIDFKDAAFDQGQALLRYFGDAFDSSELRASFTPTFKLPIAGELITTALEVDYLNGTMGNTLATPGQESTYSFLNAGIHPSLVILRDDLTLTLGIAGFVSLDTENSETDFFVYPKITASYRVVGEYFIGYAGLEGDLKQNNYHDFVSQNPFVSPTLTITTTDQQYDGYVGVKGKLSSNVSYNLRGNYISETDRALYRFNRFDPDNTTASEQSYANNNSFGIVYDDLKTTSVFGELNFDVNANFKMKVNATYNSYSTDDEEEAWNLPDITASVFGDYQITEQWFAGLNLFFVGERFDQRQIDTPGQIGLEFETVALESYFDANVHAGYRFNEQLSIFGRVNNLLDNNYEKWLNYKVQGLQGMLGATYKFDF